MEKQIVSAEVSPTIEKRMTMRGMQFGCVAIMTDENGGKHTYFVSAERKKNVATAVERFKTAIEKKEFFAGEEMIIRKFSMF